MTVRKWGFGCGAVGLLLMASCCAWVAMPRPQSCPNRDQIKIGMTADEVRSILGDPNHEDARPDNINWYYECGVLSLSPPISVSFGKDGRVEYVYILD